MSTTTEQPVTPSVSMVGKITAKTAGVNPKALLGKPETQTEMSLCTIYGIASGVKEKEFNGKMFYPLIGLFQAVNSETGAITRSGVLYLPEGIHENYEQAARKLEGEAEVRFAIELVAFRASNPQGYSYKAKDLAPVIVDDPLTAFTKSISNGHQAALPIPAAETPTPKPEPAKVAAPAHKGNVRR